MIDQKKGPSKEGLFDSKVFISIGLTVISLVTMLFLAPKSHLDSRLYYSPSVMIEYVRRLTAGETQNYFYNQFLDLFLISSYTTVLILFYKRLHLPLRWAFLPGVLDLLETVPILLIMGGWIDVAELSWLGVITLLKWVGGAIAVAPILWKLRQI